MAEQRSEWFLNTVTGKPELGKLSPSYNRMGPYPSYEDALDAWKIVKKRNKAWEEEDRRWRQEWEVDPDGSPSGGDQDQGGDRDEGQD